MKTILLLRLGLAIGMLWVGSAFALQTAYVSFDHPEGWRCELASGVWICQSGAETDRKDSVVLSIATVAGEWDSLENFEDFLKKPRFIEDDDGTKIENKITYVRRRNINGYSWVDSLQQNSELPGFWTRYLATVYKTAKSKVAILITYVVADERYAQIAPAFEKMVSSLRPNAEFDVTVASKQAAGEIPGNQILGPTKDTKDILRERLNLKRKKDAETDSDQSEGMSPAVGLALLVGVGLFVFIRRRKRNASSSGGK